MMSNARPHQSPRSPVAVDQLREAAQRVRPTVLVLMGVSGSGKSTIALQIQHLLGWPFQEGDDLHPPANVEKMRSGKPLDDADRLPWLHAVAGWIEQRLTAGEPGIITCSNLKREYRRITIDGHPGVTLVYLRGDAAAIGPRLRQRVHRYMPPSLLDSQFEILEEPSEDESPVIVDIRGTVAETVLELLQRLAAPS